MATASRPRRGRPPGEVLLEQSAALLAAPWPDGPAGVAHRAALFAVLDGLGELLGGLRSGRDVPVSTLLAGPPPRRPEPADAVDDARLASAQQRLADALDSPGAPPVDLVAVATVRVVLLGDRLDVATGTPPADSRLLRPALAATCRTMAAALAERHPGRSVEVRVPPFAAVQCAFGDPGPRHTRGTPPNVVEAAPRVFLRLADGRLTWAEAVRTGAVAASGLRADLSRALPVSSGWDFGPEFVPQRTD